MASAFFGKYDIYSGRSNPVEEIAFRNFYESNLTEARFEII